MSLKSRVFNFEKPNEFSPKWPVKTPRQVRFSDKVNFSNMRLSETRSLYTRQLPAILKNIGLGVSESKSSKNHPVCEIKELVAVQPVNKSPRKHIYLQLSHLNKTREKRLEFCLKSTTYQNFKITDEKKDRSAKNIIEYAKNTKKKIQSTIHDWKLRTAKEKKSRRNLSTQDNTINKSLEGIEFLQNCVCIQTDDFIN